MNWVNLEKGDTTALISSRRLNNKFVLSRNISKLLKLGRKAMLIKEESPLSLKWVITFI